MWERVSGGREQDAGEDMKGWLRRAELEETQEGYVGAGDNWRLLV